MSSENDGRNANVRGREMPEEVEAAHSGHPQIEHEATGGLALGGGQELFRRGERLDSEAHRPQEIPQRATERSVIVHDGDHRRFLRGHALSLSLDVGIEFIDYQARLSGGKRLPYVGRDELYPTLGGFEPLPAGVIPSRAAKRTKSATEPACIFAITCARCSLTVASVVPSSPAICLLRRPATIRASTSRSRRVREA